MGVRFRFAWADGTSIDYRPTEVPVPTITIKPTDAPAPAPAAAHMLEDKTPTVFSKDEENPAPIALSKDTGLSMSPTTPAPADTQVSPADTSVSKETFTVSFYNYIPLYILCVLLFLVSAGLIRGYSAK